MFSFRVYLLLGLINSIVYSSYGQQRSQEKSGLQESVVASLVKHGHAGGVSRLTGCSTVGESRFALDESKDTPDALSRAPAEAQLKWRLIPANATYFVSLGGSSIFLETSMPPISLHDLNLAQATNILLSKHAAQEQAFLLGIRLFDRGMGFSSITLNKNKFSVELPAGSLLEDMNIIAAATHFPAVWFYDERVCGKQRVASFFWVNE